MNSEALQTIQIEKHVVKNDDARSTNDAHNSVQASSDK